MLKGGGALQELWSARRTGCSWIPFKTCLC